MYRLEVDFPSVFPAKAGIQVLRVRHPLATLDARFRGHDGPSLRLKHDLSTIEAARDSNHRRERH